MNKLLIILLGLSMTACQQQEASRQVVSNGTTHTPTIKIQNVEVVNPTSRSFTAKTLITGTAMPHQIVKVKSMESGIVSNIKMEIGDYVRKGDAIAYLSNPVINQLVSDANANLSIAQADMMTIKASLVAAKAEETSKLSLYKRLKSIVEQTPGLTNISDVEKAAGDAQMATAIVAASNAKIAAQNKKIEAFRSRVVIAEKRKSMLTVRAPFSGVITSRSVDVGAMIQSGISNPSAGSIVEIQDLDPIRLTLPIPASDARAISKGMEVEVVFPELEGKSVVAKITRTARVLDADTKTMKVEIDIPNKDGKILSGMYAKAQMKLASRTNVLSLPYTAQFTHQDAPYVMIVNNKGIVERMKIRKGLTGKDYFEVLNGEITKDTKIIVKGKGLVKVGQKVNAVLR